MADETVPAQNPEEFQADLDKSREAAARLLESLAQKIGASPAVRAAASNVHRAAQYVQAHSVRDIAAGIQRAVRRRPAYAVAAAVLAGFLAGRALRSR